MVIICTIETFIQHKHIATNDREWLVESVKKATKQTMAYECHSVNMRDKARIFMIIIQQQLISEQINQHFKWQF